MTDRETCFREHGPEKELIHADTVEVGVRIDCEREDCGPHEIYYHDEMVFL